jgi:hypothetical protein
MTTNIAWAVDQLQKGLRVSRKPWNRRWLVIVDGEIRNVADQCSSASDSPCWLSSADLLASDWCVV